MHSFTQEDLVQYLYKETSKEKSAILKAAIECDWRLREKFEAISAAILSLERLDLSPRKVVLDHIVKYAKRAVKKLPSEV